jgi:hypothetical protein
MALAGCSSNRVLHAPVDTAIGQQAIDVNTACASAA